MSKGKTGMLFISSLFVLSLASPAQGQSQPSQPPAEQKPAPAPNKPDSVIPKPDAPGSTAPVQAPTPQRVDPGSRYVLGPQDQLKITVFDEPDLSNIYRVDSDGFITFPMISKVSAVGITPAELQDRIKTMLALGYIKNPQVRVEVEGYKSQSVIVSGEIRSPGKVPMTGTMTLIEALAAAGSPTSSASNEISISRQKRNAAGVVTDENDVDIIRVNLKALQLGQAGRDIQLQDGDLINVPKAQTFYIIGQVRNPGSLVWEPGMTLQQAIALAGGLTERGSDRRIKADRFGPDGKVTEVSLNLEDKVQPNDTIKISSRIF